MNDLTGQSFGRYHLVERLGEGGMAVVYKAFDTRLECDVAVKVIRLDNLPRSSEEVALKRFEREAKSVAQLTHPYIVKVSDFGEEDGLPYLVMEYLSGGTLKQYLGTPLPYRKAAKLLVPVAQALEYAHSHNLVHRDVKPSNILITESGQPMLTDFGIAKIMDMQDGQTLTGTGVGIGTPEYMAPEQWTGNITPSVDIFSLGVVFYELVTGHKPYTADTPAAVLIKLISDPLPKPSKFVADLPEKAEQVIFKALAKKPEDRYQTMDELEKALDDLQTFENRRKEEKTENIHFATLEQLSKDGEISNEYEKPAEVEISPCEEKLPALSVEETENIEGTRPQTIQSIEPEEESATRLESPSVDAVRQPPMAVNLNGLAWAKDKQNRMKLKLEDDVFMEFIRIPAGEFLMGSDPKIDVNSWEDEQPQHKVYLNEYWIARMPVNRLQYQIYARSTKGLLYQWMNDINLVKNRENHPITDIDWKTAVDFCDWFSDMFDLSVALPTEAQWEKAARGTDGRIFPWDNEIDPEQILKTRFDDQKCKILGVNQDEASPYGVLDISGRVWEWVNDWYSKSYYLDSPKRNPLGPETGTHKVVRGGSWLSQLETFRCASRKSMIPYVDSGDLGFRCVINK